MGSLSASRRIAAIDVGTNAVLLTIAEPLGTNLTVLEERATLTRLGQGVDRTGTLNLEAQRRTLECFSQYRTLLDEYSCRDVAVAGTSALRDARGSALFLAEAERILNAPIQIISGEREAQLTFRGAISDLELNGSAFVFDIGGGSTELIIGCADSRKVTFATSLDIGSVRLAERFQFADPPTHKQLTALRAVIRRSLAPFTQQIQGAQTVIAVAGTATTLALASGLPSPVHQSEMDQASLKLVQETLNTASIKDRLTMPGVTEGRADVIGCGAILCEEIVQAAQRPSFRVSDRGVRFGLLLESAQRPEQM